MGLTKILLLSFGNPGEQDPAIVNQSFTQTAKGRISLSTHTITKIPQIGELFMVNGEAHGELVFKCIRVDGNELKSKVEGHEFVIFGTFVHRLAFIEDDQLRNKLMEFRI